MKMIIVDDEIGIANSIKNIFDWKEIGVREVCVFDSGIEALERIRKGDIDILMTDIRMPELDGLELAEKAIETTPDMKIIMFSGYDDFEYAKAAMRIGVMEYLLKPVTLEEVTDAVKRAADLRRQECIKNKIKTEYENSLDMYIQNTKNMLSAKLIQKNTVLKAEELKKYFEIIGIESGYNYGVAICIRIIGQNSNETWNMQEDYALLCFAIDNILNEILTGKGHSFHDGFGNTVVIIFGESDIREYHQLTEKCISALRDTLGIEIAVGVGDVSDNISSLYMSYSTAIAACRHGYFYKKSGICDIDSLENQYQYPQELENKLLEHITFTKLNQEESIDSIINKYFEDVVKQADVPVQNLKTICDNVLMACAKKLRTMNSQKEDTLISEWLEMQGNIETADDLRNNLLKHMHKAEEILETWTRDKNKLLVENAKKYIEEHISEDLSLEVVSKIFFFSSRYFARLFKEYTGKTYSDYVNDTKMEIAKDYLSNTDFSIGEIGRKIGYEDQGHFGRNFKKYTGLKPSEYRKRI